MGKRLLGLTELSERYGIRSTTLAAFLRNQELARGAKVGGKIDIDHPGMREWMKRKEAGTRGKFPYELKARVLKEIDDYLLSTADDETDIAEDNTEYEEFQRAVDAALKEFDKYLGMTLEQIIRKHGTDRMFKEYIDTCKKLEDITAVRLKNHRARGELIEREYVRTFIVAFIDTLLSRMLNDSPRTIVMRLWEEFEAQQTKEHAEETVRSLLSDLTRGTKSKIVKRIEDAG